MASITSTPGEPARRFEGRVAAMTLALGAATAVAVALFYSLPAAAGIAMGTALAWLNFRWLDEVGRALVRMMQAQPATAGAARPVIPFSTWVKFFARYALIALVLYVTVTRSPVPAVSVVGGLLMLGAAAMAVSLYEVLLEMR